MLVHAMQMQSKIFLSTEVKGGDGDEKRGVLTLLIHYNLACDDAHVGIKHFNIGPSHPIFPTVFAVDNSH